MSNSTISDQSLMDKSMRSVFVGNIPYEATEENLKDIFSEVGPVLSFKLVFDRETGKPKGYGFCEYKDQETALSAMRNLNGYEIGGRTLRVDNACTEKSRMEMQSLLQGQNTENPYGEAVQSDKAPEAISKAVASLPPEQMFELMKQMKLCVQNNPNEARQMLLQNPQLAYALLQAQVVMRIVDPHTAVNMLHKANPIPGVLTPSDKPAVHPVVPRIEEPWAPTRPAAVTNPPAPIFAGQDVDLRTLDRQMDPRLARMDQDLRGPQQVQPTPVSASPAVPANTDPRALSTFNISDNTLPVEGVESFCRDPRTDRFGRDPRDPRDPRMPIDPRITKANPPVPVALPVVPRPVAAPTGPSSNVATASVATPVTALTTSTTSATSRLMAGMSPAGNIPSGASDQEKAALIMQVLQLSDEQIAMLPPEQRQSILLLKEQIAKSAQR
ncbi:cleavage stimulation factor subunit 2 isoform X1 [Bombus vosnesenskii]|uniref:Cleavage stimulation factor subunit 2 isoform X1 n=3 Tax=Pyrobombus TaxID=144703 RepID=A0A6J3JVK5_9HYME|nr:cleavage stimulation factor subunit 2 isoform X1 [Bombus impatiens]XP_033201495.1 cleavage stimulation factor subunit 2 isoform X1 [Bombus vancouverensis nearcticus]XP_033298464.1 cleavage stimulation factor subunit 2 isoform X1 [Bombus bifarius]XP_033344857.1 cleavage stimulation factor subunit 2 isoform X1 [Bombus vosnesenskii]XP_050475343.1 cleavage stimulation factor subunit 2 isoform X1 [Bombus huntii]